MTAAPHKQIPATAYWVLFALMLVAIALLFRPGGFHDPYSTVVLDKNGKLLGAMIADDGQWRFPEPDSIPEKMKKCIILFEDKNFERHFGVDIPALGRAAYLNLKHRQIVSGGSTISMQVIRLMRKGKSRTVSEKIIEIFLATRLEMIHSKEDILGMYLSHAPFGGNVVGLEAAAWRYFACSPEDLTWADAACLAVLPNAPSLIHPGRNRELLVRKRNHLLDRLLETKQIDSLGWMLAQHEPLPLKPRPLPQISPHLLARLNISHKGMRVRTTIDKNIQLQAQDILNEHVRVLKGNEIHNACALILEVESGNVLAYIGNTSLPGRMHGEMVDVVTSARSSGSIFKPLLYAALLDDGRILPGTLIPDIPTYMSGFSPKNFNDSYDGAVYADKALSRSLNIPAVNMLREYGVDRFHSFLGELGITTLSRSAGVYGLSLILGGAETSLWDIAGTYASMSRTLNHFYGFSGKYATDDFHPPVLLPGTERSSASFDEPRLRAASIWRTYKALEEVNRPEREANWEAFASSRKIAWKTGTSFGFRDAWSVGTDPAYVVAVWAGNADGEGRPGLTGVGSAAPILFELFDLLPRSGWFDIPWDELEYIAVCHESGHRMGQHCTQADSVWVPRTCLKSGPCPYHKSIHLDRNRRYRVSEKCVAVNNMIHERWFELPPAMAWYFKDKHAWYKEVPPYLPGCEPNENKHVMEFIYPENAAKIYIPVQLDGRPGETVFELAHASPEISIYWHLDEEYLGKTSVHHQMGISTEKGMHMITVVDENGEMISVSFEVK